MNSLRSLADTYRALSPLKCIIWIRENELYYYQLVEVQNAYVSAGEKVPIAKIICVGMYPTGNSRTNASEMFIKSFRHLLRF